MKDIITIVNTNKELVELFETNDEILVYGAGNVGKLLIKRLKTLEYETKVPFLAVSNLDDNPMMVDDIPVVELDALSLYKKEPLLIATITEYTQEIESILLGRGFFNVYCLGQEMIDDLRKNRGNDEQKLLANSLQNLMTKISNIECKIEQQAEVCEVNSKAFSKYKNCHTGQEVVVFATGPSANDYIPIKNAVHIGLNLAWKRKDIDFDYFFLQDGFGGKNNPAIPILEEKIIKNKLFVGTYLKRATYYCSEFSPGYEALQDNISRYFVDYLPDRNRKERYMNLYPNICYHPLIDFGSVVFPAIQFALFTNPKRIYLVGCDATNVSHFYDENHNLVSKSVEIPNEWKMGYTLIKMYAHIYYPNIDIISINPVKLKGLFHEIDYNHKPEEISK